jgi:threonyl-tRNA synthetase
MLQRIYGTAWETQEDLDSYLLRLEEAEKRDHRKLGKELDLFHFQEEAPGAVFWHPKGWTLFQNLINYMRKRQDDAHIFCTEDQVTEESKIVCDLILSIYKDFGFEKISIKFSDRPEKRVGSDEIWDKSELALKKAVEATGLEYTYNPGEGAFYGPKLEFVLRDAIGRDWQCGTLQVDLNMPERLGGTFIGEDGQKHHPVMLHRALFGSLERFTGILLEHYAGNLPLWLAPVQAVVAPITSEIDNYAMEIFDELKLNGVRVNLDTRNEKINYKIRDNSLQKIPYMLIVGKQEQENKSISVRQFGSKDQEIIKFENLTDFFEKKCMMPTN